MTKQIWTSYHIKDIPERYNLKESDVIKLFCTTDLTLQNDNINYLNKYLGELCTMYYVWKNQIKSDYVGFQHYRMLFKNIETSKDILLNNGWCGDVIQFFNNGGLQTHILYQSIQYLSNKLNIKTSEIINIMQSNIICFDGNVFMCKWHIFEDLCETIFGFFNYLFPNQSWKNKNTLYAYITDLHLLFVNNKNIIRDHWYWAQDSYDWNPRYMIYFMEYFIPLYLNIKYNIHIYDKEKYFDTNVIDNNNIIFEWKTKVILCDFEYKNISIEQFKKWYELNNCTGINCFYIINYKQSDVYKNYVENDGLFYGKYRYAKFLNDLSELKNYDSNDIYIISLDEYIDTVSYKFYTKNIYEIKKIK